MLVLLGMIAIFALGFFFEGQEELSRQSRRATIVKQIADCTPRFDQW